MLLLVLLNKKGSNFVWDYSWFLETYKRSFDSKLPLRKSIFFNRNL